MGENLIKSFYVTGGELQDEIRKAADAGERLVRVQAIRRTFVGKSDDGHRRFMTGGWMESEVVEIWLSEAILRDVKERLMKANPAALVALDAGRIWESDLLRIVDAAPAALAAEPEPAQEPLRKSAEPEPHAFVLDGDGTCLSCFRAKGDALHVRKSLVPGEYPSVKAEFVITLSAEEMRKSEAEDIVEAAYDSAVKTGAITRRTADDALSRLVEQIRKGEV